MLWFKCCFDSAYAVLHLFVMKIRQFMLPKKMCSKYSQKHAKTFKYEGGGVTVAMTLGQSAFKKLWSWYMISHLQHEFIRAWKVKDITYSLGLILKRVSLYLSIKYWKDSQITPPNKSRLESLHNCFSWHTYI